jgi:hypothetical protein
MRARSRTQSCHVDHAMTGLAQAAALISAVVYIAAAPLELFFVSSPRVRVLFMSGRVRRADGRAPH